MAAPSRNAAQTAFQEATRIFAVADSVFKRADHSEAQLSEDDLNLLGDLLRKTDILLSLAREHGEADRSPEIGHLLPEARAIRQHAYLLLATQNPDQAWYWTEEWQAGERETDAQIAAGEGTIYDSGEEFLAPLREETD